MSLPPQGPLTGTLVLDLSRVMAGPFATQMLGDMGATILKVEEPTHGDDSRAFAPPFWGDESAYFMSANRNKRSMAVDLRKPEGIALMHQLAAKAHVVVENFRPGTADRMGLGYKELSAINPRLVYVSVSGFGLTGPEAKRAGYDVLAQAMGGIMSLTGDPTGAPVKVGIPQADLIAGLHAVIGTLLGLIARDRTGSGQHIDTSLLETQVSLLTFAAMGYFATGKQPRRMGNRHSSITPYETYQAADGHFTVAVGNDRMWPAFCRIIKRPELESDARFTSNPLRVAHIDELGELLRPIFTTRSVASWMQAFDEAGIPAGPLLTVPQALEHPQVVARDMVVDMEHPTAGAIKVLGSPIKLSATPPSYELPPPVLGQHTHEILRTLLDLDAATLASLEDQGVIKQWHPPEQAPAEPAVNHEETAPAELAVNHEEPAPAKLAVKGEDSPHGV
jgi:crotonobetainyl-CoA:carnitine CoA-transferase CaiB-like acyl-CoA transferase